jgi:hypothetical protein
MKKNANRITHNLLFQGLYFDLYSQEGRGAVGLLDWKRTPSSHASMSITRRFVVANLSVGVPEARRAMSGIYTSFSDKSSSQIASMICELSGLLACPWHPPSRGGKLAVEAGEFSVPVVRRFKSLPLHGVHLLNQCGQGQAVSLAHCAPVED